MVWSHLRHDKCNSKSSRRSLEILLELYAYRSYAPVFGGMVGRRVDECAVVFPRPEFGINWNLYVFSNRETHIGTITCNWSRCMPGVVDGVSPGKPLQMQLLVFIDVNSTTLNRYCTTNWSSRRRLEMHLSETDMESIADKVKNDFLEDRQPTLVVFFTPRRKYAVTPTGVGVVTLWSTTATTKSTASGASATNSSVEPRSGRATTALTNLS